MRAVAAAEDGTDRDRVLTSLRGVGLWTAAETRIRALGDADAVSVGDYPPRPRGGLRPHRTRESTTTGCWSSWRHGPDTASVSSG